MLEFCATQQGGKPFADGVEVGFRFVTFFPAFDFIPLLEDGIGGGGIAECENMRVATHEFFADATGHIVEIETAGFFGEFAVENHLQE